MASKRFDEISKQIDNLKGNIDQLNAAITKYKIEGKTLAEIQVLVSGKSAELAKAFVAVVNANETFQKSSRASVEAKEKLAKAIGTVNTKYKSLSRTINGEINQAIKNQGKELNGIQSDLRKLTAAETEWINNAKREQKNRLFQIDQERKQRAKDRKEKVNDAKREFGDIVTAVKGRARIASETRKAAEANKFFGKTFRAAFSPQAIGRAIASVVKFIGIYQLLGSVISGIQAITIGSIRQFINFQEAIGNLSAVSNANREEIKQLTSSIRDTAVQTKFTAIEVADLATSLAKLGATAQEIPSLILPVSLAAQALGESLDTVGETILKVNNQFGLSSSESVLSAQTLVSAINDSALSLNSFNTAIQYIGPIAAQVGLNFAETAEYLKLLSDNGFTASRIGTGLRTIFIDLKESGKPLADTLDELAEKNISVAEAEELVGKRAAAQLLTLVRNREELNSLIGRQEAYVDSISAASRQLSTYAGKIKILESAYENLRISIGETLTNSQVFLNVLDKIDAKSGRLARGYALLQELVLDYEKVFYENVGNTLEGSEQRINEYQALFNTVTSTNEKKGDRFVNLWNNVAKQVKLTANESYQIITALYEGTFDEVAKEMQLTKEQIRLTEYYYNSAIGYRGRYTSSIREGLKTYNGALEILREQRRETEKGLEVEGFRTAKFNEYKDLIDELEGDKLTDQEKFNKAVEEEIEIRTELNNTQEKLRKEYEKGSLANQSLIRQLEGEAQGYEQVLTRLSEFTEDLIEKDAQRVAQSLKSFNAEKKALDLKRKKLDTDLEEAEKTLAFEKKAAEQRFKQENELAATQEERQEANLRRTKAINEAQSKYEKTVVGITESTADLTDEYDRLWSKYRGIFAVTKGQSKEEKELNEKRKQALATLENAAEQSTQQLERLNFQILQSQENLGFDSQKLGNQILGEGLNIINSLNVALDDLSGLYGDSASQQSKLATAQREAVEIASENLESLKERYRQLYASIALVMGEDAAKELLGPMLEVLQILDKQLNDVKLGNVISDNEVKELNKKFRVIKEGILELDIDTTLKDVFTEAVNASMEALDRFNQTSFENTKNRLEAEKKAITDAYDTEDAILKSKLDNQLISESEYRSRVKKLREKEAAEQNKIDKQIFNAEKKRDKQKAFTDYVSALGSIIPNLITKHGIGEPIEISLKYALAAALATFGYSTEVQAINQRQFFPTRFAEGGMVYGPSHEQGGIPFSVSGQAGYEMEGGEYIVNKKATSRYKTLLDQINSYGRSDYKFASGGIVNSTERKSDKQLEYLEAIAEATVSTAINSSKPVRSFVTSDDLSTNENARRLRQRNTNI